MQVIMVIAALSYGKLKFKNVSHINIENSATVNSILDMCFLTILLRLVDRNF